MADGNSVVKQFQLILHDILSEGIVLLDAFKVASVIEKLPPCWREFKSYLKQKWKEMSLEELIVKLRIEEDIRKMDDKYKNSMEAKINLTEQDEPLKKRKRPNDDKGKKPISSKLRFNDNCYNCSKPNHMSRDYKAPKREVTKEKGKELSALILTTKEQYQIIQKN